jgi:PKD repeat protein
MPHCQSAQRRLLLLLAGAALLICAFAGSALADPYGELGHFGSAGTGHGEFKITESTQAFGVEPGVEPADDYIYVGDEPQVGQFRIQKLTAAGAFVAETKPFKPPRHAGMGPIVEGIAVDPTLKRIYVLATEQRGALERDPDIPAAGTLYAFSTEPSGEVLVPATGTTGGVLAGPSVLEPQSDAPERALLRPKGIAVDPTKDDVIVMGEVDQGSEGVQTRVTLERVHADGTVGERYVDDADFFGEEAQDHVNSPVVSPGGAVYVERDVSEVIPEHELLPESEVEFNQIVRIPSDFGSTQAPTPLVRLAMPISELEENPVVKFDFNFHAPEQGGGLSIAPEGTEGAIYTDAYIFMKNPNKHGGSYYPGAMVFDETDGSEIGWTGGQTTKSESCRIGYGGATYPSVAAGGNHTVFVLDPALAHVVEFGPGGHGCPIAEATNPSATINGNPLAPSETVPITTPVTFSSTMTQANALSVEWDFGDGTTETKSEDEYQHTEVEHTFAQSGELTVTETIHTDDLATPTIVKQTKVSVSANAIAPTAILEGPTEVTLGGGGTLGLGYLEGGGLGLVQATPGGVATFDGSASFDPNPGSNGIKAYHWVFDDGESETTPTATVEHRYEKAGVYTVELTVTDVHELTSQPSTLTVKVAEAPPEVKHQEEQPATLIAPPVTAPPPAVQPPPAPVPNARLASASLAASPTGSVRLEVTCPVGESDCAGTVTLRTLGAISISAAHTRRSTKKSRAAVLTLASGAFTVPGGQRESVTLRLSAQARALLAHTHMVHAQATLVAHDSAGATYSSQLPVVLSALTATHGRGSRGKR